MESIQYSFAIFSGKYSRLKACISLKATQAHAKNLKGYLQSGRFGLIRATALSGIISGVLW